MRYRLILGSDDDQKVFPLEGATATIGRDKANDIQLVAGDVSRVHARITMAEDGCTIEDLKSANSTCVNGKEITRHKLTNGDEVGVGSFVLRFEEGEKKIAADARFVPREYSDRSLYATVKIKPRSG